MYFNDLDKHSESIIPDSLLGKSNAIPDGHKTRGELNHAHLFGQIPANVFSVGW